MAIKKRGTRKSQSLKNRQKRIAGRGAFFLVWLRRFGLALAVVTGVIWCGSWLWLSGSVHKAGQWTVDQVLMATVDAGFGIKNIYVEGRYYADATVLQGLIGLESGDALLGANVREIQDKISQMAWVETARVERRMPDTLYVELQERVPVARYKDSKSDRMVILDQYGESITDYKLSRFQDYIIVTGEGAAGASAHLVGLLKGESEIYKMALFAHRVSDRRWDIKFKSPDASSSITVKLPEKDMALALKRLARAHHESQLLDRNLISIDLRDKERMVLKTMPGQVQDYRASYSRRDQRL